MSALEKLMLEIEKHAVMRAHASLIQDAREELKGFRLLVDHHKEHHAEDLCTCGRELVVTRADVNCPVHGLPSIAVDPTVPGRGKTLTELGINKDEIPF